MPLNQTESDSFCKALGIPDHLHQNNRIPNQKFCLGEKLYRRFPLKDSLGSDNIIVNPNTGKRQLSITTPLRIEDLSCLRSSHCNCPEDVFYNSESDDHYCDHGIFELITQEVENWKFTHPEDNNKSYTLKIFHDPGKCMYPHVEIRIFENINIHIQRVSSKIVKQSIRSAYQESLTIINP